MPPSPSTARPWLALLVAAALAPALAACGTGGRQDGPVLVGSFPADGATVPTGLSSVRLDFDERVRLFRVNALAYSADGVGVGVHLHQDPGEDHSLRVEALAGQVLGPGTVVLDVLEGLVLDDDDHYALEPSRVTLHVTGTPSLWLGSPTTNQVTEIDGATYAPVAATATPGGRDPVGILAVALGGTTRVFVQLASGAGTGRSLAVFAPGAATMTEIPLTPSPGSDLTASAPALALSADGRTLYAAYRDTLTQTVRLHRVRVSDGVETGVLGLSPAATAATAPTALELHADGMTLLATCREGASGRLCYVEAGPLAEQDHDGSTLGTQGAPLGLAPAGARLLGANAVVAPATGTTAALAWVALGSDVVSNDASTQTGVPAALLATHDGAFVVEGLAAPGAAPDLLCVRPGGDLTADAPLAVSDLVGALAQGATSVRALARVPGQARFHALLDAGVLARFAWSAGGVVQEDLDGATAGVQAVSLAVSAPGAACLGILAGAYPP